jgi:hypothetical protein
MKHTYTKKEALKIVIATAKEYHRILEGINYLFIYRNRKNNCVEFFESVFLPRNFLHLTGLEYVNSEGKVQNNAIDFYNKCIKNILVEEEIRFKADGTTSLKLQALPKLVNFLQFSKITTLYNGVRPKLSMERIAGTTNYCMGFVKDNEYYVPNSCLLEDIRNLGENPSQILAIFSKSANDKGGVYKNICYVAKGVPIEKIQMPKKLREKIILENKQTIE